jgi:CelD/BcsL family acetyltransferase involved in cellulose biosynthesis
MQLEIIQSLGQLQASAAAWNDLWQRSDRPLPTGRAELLDLWLRTFAQRARPHLLTVVEQGRLVAALPLCVRRKGVLGTVASLPSNHWTTGGDFLLDRDCDGPAACELLADAVARLGCWWIDLEGYDAGSPRWQALLAALERRDLPRMVASRFQVGRVALSGDWEAYLATRSRNHRRQMRVAQRRAELLGPAELRIHRELALDEVEPLVRRGFEIEDRSWKGAAGSSVLRDPRVLEFFIAHARLLAEGGHLCLVFLEVAGQAIAFEYGWQSGGVYYPAKVGYDEQFAQLTPGQLLRWQLFEEFCREGACHTVDFLGPLVEATARWSTCQYEVARARFAPERAGCRAALSAVAAGGFLR